MNKIGQVSLLCSGSVLLLERSWPNHSAMYSRGGTKERAQFLPWACMQRTLRSPQNHKESLAKWVLLARLWTSLQNRKESLTKWVLLAHFVQRLLPFLQVMCKLSEDWEDFEARHDAPKLDSRSRNFWCLRHWFHGTVLKYIWQPVHLGCSGLRLQMGRSRAYQDQRQQSGCQISQGKPLLPFRYPVSNNLW